MPQAFLLILLLSLSVFAQSGKVVGVSDGDTITVLTTAKKQIKVRLAGIDAPEKGQDYGDAAKKYLSFFVYGENVTLQGSKVDRYGRQISKVLIDGKDVNLVMVLAGLAWHFKEYEREQSTADRKIYADAEKTARKSKLNIWSYPDPTAPWDYRAGRTSPGRSTESPAFRSLVSRPVPQSNAGQIIGNKNSMIYHYPSCPSYNKVSLKNRVYFRTAQDAERAGYRVAKNC